jgi:serine protease Do
MVKALLPQLKAGRVIRGYMGVVVQDLSPELRQGLGLQATRGALVSEVNPNSPAARAGLQPGDVITSFDRKPVASATQMSRDIATLPPRSVHPLAFSRGEMSLHGQVALEEKPAPGDGRPTGSGDAATEAPAPRSRIGIAMQDVSPGDAQELGLPPAHAVVIVRVEPGSSADDAGLQPGDAILQVGRTPMASARQVAVALKRARPGSQLVLRVQRKEAALFVSLPVPVG